MQSPSRASTSQTRLEHFLPATNASTTSTTPNAPPGLPYEEHTQRIYVLCAVVGSGKSTLATQLEALYPEHYVRVNQDSLGNRKKWSIIDRQNFDVSQRYTWLDIGHSAGVEVVALVFTTPKQVCADRLRLRTNHETIKSAAQGIEVLNNISGIWTPPTPQEGFHRIVQLPSSLPLRYTLSDLNAILTSVDASPILPGILPPPPPPTGRNAFFAGRGRGSTNRGSLPPPGSRNLMSSWLSNGPPAASTSSPPRSESRSRPYYTRGAFAAARGSRGGTRGRGGGSHFTEAGQPIDLTGDNRQCP